MLPTSGALATYGSQSKGSLDAGISLVNKAGGIDGRQVKLTVIDDGGDGAQAVAKLQAYLSDHSKPDAVFSQYSSEALPLAPLTTQAGIFSVTSSITPALTDPKKFPYTFQQSIPIRTVIDVSPTTSSTRVTGRSATRPSTTSPDTRP
ncbi:hypothetical protein FRACA_5610001 [Frankia canadensis]|uniref:Leucine-binding protein domain-containing protein n=1 Tax=Frankia canadensis TaxID=1836972 RepID=A0A2I2KZ11_9ACTN|nr:hypothetical protein FRACA_5610001 [Frankia canadensis]SOU58202.1 hypothetical protein FRACA_5610001 [Frankia canadensis]